MYFCLIPVILSRKNLTFVIIVAILMVIVAVILVGTAGIQQSDDSESSGGEVILGLGFILLAQAVTAVQFIAEESLMNNKVRLAINSLKSL